MRSRFTAALLMLSITATTLPVPRSHASLGAMTTSVGMGVVFIAAGCGSLVYGTHLMEKSSREQLQGKYVQSFAHFMGGILASRGRSSGGGRDYPLASRH